MPFTAQAAFEALDRVTAPVRKMERAVTKFARAAQVQVSKANTAFNRLAKPLKSVNKLLGGFGVLIGGAAIVGGLTSAVGVFKDFEQSGANLGAILNKTTAQIKPLTEQAKLLGATTKFTATQVVGLQTEFGKLGFSPKEILESTAATSALAAATGTELPQAAKQVGSAIRAFGLETKESARVADVFALATSKSALDMAFLDTAMSKVAPVAKQFGFSIEDTTALLSGLADAGFDASTAATSTRSILLNLADANGKLAKSLGKPVKTLPELTAALKKLKDKNVDLGKLFELTDKQSVAAFATFVDGTAKTQELADAYDNAKDSAEKMAAKQLDTLGGSITLLQSAYDGFILSLEDGTGAFATQLRTIIDVTTEILSLASGTAKAGKELNEKEKVIRQLAQTSIKWIKIIGFAVGILIAIKAVLVIFSAALSIYLGVVEAVTIAQALWNGTMLLNPVGLVIAGIMILIAIVAIMIVKWDEWGATLLLLFGPIGTIIASIVMIGKRWDEVKASFTEGGFLEGLKKIGAIILDVILLPIQQLFELLSNIPGISIAGDFASKIDALRGNLGLEVEPINPRVQKAEGDAITNQNALNGGIEMNINNNTDSEIDFSATGALIPLLNNTFI